ncbi:hypothetical protein K7432_007748 [Basidiobolus ranarum]|uniref:Serine/threonine-protein kinase Chk2 n=1 Tax=Basidiobolus ranarum TaxID=34480 RepID=A0ABR2VZQ5_9FUNG
MDSATQPTQPDQSTQETPQSQEISISQEAILAKLIPLSPHFPPVDLFKEKLESGYLIGRHPECDIVSPDDRRISNKHCRIFTPYKDENSIHGTSILIEDLSSNGTFIGKKLLGKGKKILLVHGDEISFGTLPKTSGRSENHYLFQITNHGTEVQVNQKKLSAVHEKYSFRHILGTGNFSAVHLVVDKETGERYACKVIDKTRFFMKPKVKEAFAREVKILKNLNHPHIVSFVSCYDNEETLWIVMELVTGGDLLAYITEKGTLPEAECKQLFHQICLALQYLHHQGITHRDMKPENILLINQEKNTVKISDFGLAKVVSEQSILQTMCGTLTYLAPEIMSANSQKSYSQAVDLWSCGIILYLMLLGSFPFSPSDSPDSHFVKIETPRILTFPEHPNISNEAKNLLTRLLTEDPEKRINIDQTLDHPWFRSKKPKKPKEPLQDTEEVKIPSKRPLESPTATTTIKVENGSDRTDSINNSSFENCDATDKPLQHWGTLKLVPGSRTGKDVELYKNTYFFGRSSTNEIQIQEPRISGKHCKIWKSSDHSVYLKDLSANCCYVNGHPVGKDKVITLDDNDVIGIIINDTDVNDYIKYVFKSNPAYLPKSAGQQDMGVFRIPLPSPQKNRIMNIQQDPMSSPESPTTKRKKPTESSQAREVTIWGRLRSLHMNYPNVWLKEYQLVFGRRTSCPTPVRYNDQRVSNIHCTLEKRGNTVYLMDNSTNGTFVNGKLIGQGNEVALKPMDELVLVYTDAKQLTSATPRVLIGYCYEPYDLLVQCK